MYFLLSHSYEILKLKFACVRKSFLASKILDLNPLDLSIRPLVIWKTVFTTVFVTMAPYQNDLYSMGTLALKNVLSYPAINHTKKG